VVELRRWKWGLTRLTIDFRDAEGSTLCRCPQKRSFDTDRTFEAIYSGHIRPTKKIEDTNHSAAHTFTVSMN